MGNKNLNELMNFLTGIKKNGKAKSKIGIHSVEKIENIIHSTAAGIAQPPEVGAQVMCTSASEDSDPLEVLGCGGNIKLGKKEILDNTNIKLSGQFSACTKNTDGECKLCEQDIEGRAWKEYDLVVKADGKHTLNIELSYMVCTRGPGILYLSDSGQSAQAAMAILRKNSDEIFKREKKGSLLLDRIVLLKLQNMLKQQEEIKRQKEIKKVIDDNTADDMTRKEYVWKYLMENLDISEMQAAAIMGNMQQESGFYPTNAQDDPYKKEHNPEYINVYSAGDGIGWGLIQWTVESRKQGLLEYAQEKGSSVGDMDTQLEYLCMELTVGICKNSFEEFLKITDLGKAVEYFCDYIEIAGDRAIENRKDYAEKILNTYGSGQE